jgi:hypothetical protein
MNYREFAITILFLLLLAVSPAGASAQIADEDIKVTGTVVTVEPGPGCGYLLVGSPVTYSITSGPSNLVGKQIVVLVACIELSDGISRMSYVVGDRHDLVITRRNINKVEVPSSLPDGWFYLASATFSALMPNNSFKPNPHQGGAWLYAFGYIHIQSPPRYGSA